MGAGSHSTWLLVAMTLQFHRVPIDTGGVGKWHQETAASCQLVAFGSEGLAADDDRGVATSSNPEPES